MTLWFCDRCGAQVHRTSNGTTWYQIVKRCRETDPKTGAVRCFDRNIKLCEQCSGEIEKFLDDEFDKIPVMVTGKCDRRS